MFRVLPASIRRTLVVVAAAWGAACGDDGSVDPLNRGLSFRASSVRVVPDASAPLVLVNDGPRRLGPVELRSAAVVDGAGLASAGVAVVVDPPGVATLAPGASVTLTLSLVGGESLAPGTYGTRLAARVAGEDAAAVEVVVEALPAPPTTLASLTLDGPPTVLRGDAVALEVTGVDTTGATVRPRATWTVDPPGAGLVTAEGRFVAYETGPIRVAARAGGVADTLTLTATPRTRTVAFAPVAEGLDTVRFTSDLWVHGAWAYTGTWGIRAGPLGTTPGNVLRSWSLGAAGPTAVDSVVLDARTTNDVKVSADGALGVVTHEGSNDGRNGVTLLDLSDPGHPRVVSRTTAGLESGVHNAWLDGPWLYLVVDGIGSGLRILDVSSPAAPRTVAAYWAGESFLHDVYVRDGLAFLSHWDAGLVILDVGNGLAGGHPTAPVEVSRIAVPGGQTHNAWYWPERGLVFVGEEDFGTPGRLHVIDVADLRAPREVATFAVPGATPHNVWLDEEAEILYAAWYENGLRALDVSGPLLGELERQGRELGSWRRAGPGQCWVSLGTCSWAPQLHQGRLYLSDVNRGLVVVEPTGG